MKFGLREIIFVFLLASIPVGAWWFVFRPNNARNAEIIKQIEARQEKLRALNQVTGTIGDLHKEILSRKKAIGYFQTRLPSEKEIDKVLQEIWRLAEANQLTTKSIRTLSRKNDAPTSANAPREQPIVVQLEGSFMGFYAFLQALENQPRIMRIRKMKLKTSEKLSEGHVQIGFEMCVFFDRKSKRSKCPSKI